MYVVTVTLEIYPAHVNAFREAVLAQARNSLDREPQCRRFDVCFDRKRPDRVFLYELYDTETAFHVHLETDHFKCFNDTVTSWVRNKQLGTWELTDVGS